MLTKINLSEPLQNPLRSLQAVATQGCTQSFCYEKQCHHIDKKIFLETSVKLIILSFP